MSGAPKGAFHVDTRKKRCKYCALLLQALLRNRLAKTCRRKLYYSIESVSTNTRLVFGSLTFRFSKHTRLADISYENGGINAPQILLSRFIRARFAKGKRPVAFQATPYRHLGKAVHHNCLRSRPLMTVNGNDFSDNADVLQQQNFTLADHLRFEDILH